MSFLYSAFTVISAVSFLGYVIPRLRGARRNPVTHPVITTHLSDYQGNIFQKIQLGRRDTGEYPDPYHSRYLLTEKDKLCCHVHRGILPFTRIDTTWGPGWMSDTYQGTACACCGAVLTEKKVY